MSHFCAVCGFGLGFPAWKEDSASDEVCPCWYIQFGYDDWAGDDTLARASIYKQWRQQWDRGRDDLAQ